MRYALLTIFLLLLAMPATALVIDRDSTWRGDLSFDEDVRVLQGVNLAIEPGTKVIFAKGGLDVIGTLTANGAEFSGEKWDGILLKGNDSRTVLSDCLIKGAKTGVTVKGGAPVLDKLALVNNKVGIEIRGRAEGRLSNSTFQANEKVGLFVKEESTTSIHDCLFRENGRYGAYLYRAQPKTFRSNGFYDNDVALMIAYHGSNPVVADNFFENNAVAVQVDRAARPTLKNNRLHDNRTGLYAYRRSDPIVSGNSFRGNDVAVLVAYSSYPLIEGNDFVGNNMALKLEFQSSQWEQKRGKAVRASETATRTAFSGQGMRTVTEEDRKATDLQGLVEARHNWWGKSGTAELQKIGGDGNPSFIHDGRDQALFVDDGEEFPLDKVSFAPWSEAPHKEVAQ